MISEAGKFEVIKRLWEGKRRVNLVKWGISAADMPFLRISTAKGHKKDVRKRKRT